MSNPASLTTRLRADIVAGELQPGERLVEIDLMDRYAAPRRSIREALAELDKEGLIQRTANRGASVRKISLEEAIEITEVRSLLEGFLAANAAKVATDAERAELAALIERMAKAAGDDPFRTYPRLYQEFHHTLRAIDRHDTAADLVRTLRNRNAQLQFRTALMPGRVEESLREHEAIASAIIDGDSRAARRAMEKHLAAVVKALNAWHRSGAIA
ncbi:MAG: GntR family transcriptional regulator [Acidimicrobiales bacterium]